jgi:predicted membrane metal-binding protein
MGGMFSSVNFAINGGSIMPDTTILENGLLSWLSSFVTNNGGATFLIISSIALMAAATKRIVGMDSGFLNRLVTFVGTFIFFTILVLSFTKSDPTSSGVFLYTFYQAGIVGGAFYAMNRLTKNQNMLEDFGNGY